MTRCFEDISEGEVMTFGAATLSEDDVVEFHLRFSPRLPASPADRRGVSKRAAAQAHVYAIWSRLLVERTADWPVIARIGQDQVRWYKTAFAGDVLSVRVTILAKQRVDAFKGMVLAQHDVLNQHGELVLSLMTRTVLACRDAPFDFAAAEEDAN